MDENHNNGTLGLAPLDTCHQQPGNAQPLRSGVVLLQYQREELEEPFGSY